MKFRTVVPLILGLAACAPAKVPEHRVADADHGRRVYSQYCATCHGVYGDGAGNWVRYGTKDRPRDFTLGLYKFRSTSSGTPPTDADLAKTVRRGLPGTAMAGWDGVMPAGDVADVVAYIKGLAKPRAEPVEPEVVRIPEKIQPTTPAAVARGRNLFLLLKCWDCHGVRGEGDGPAARDQKDAAGRPIAPRDLTTGVFKGGRDPKDIYRTLATGLDGTPMVAVFDNPRTMLAPLVLQRAQYQKDMRVLEGRLEPSEVAALRKFVSTLPSPQELEKYRDAHIDKLLDRWRWDLVHYVRDVSAGGAKTRALLGEE